MNQLTQTAVSDQKEQKISFYAVGSDGRIGYEVFDVQTKLGKKKVVYTYKGATAGNDFLSV